MKNILCFGDSNTWGYPPGGDSRYPWPVRWTGVLQQALGDGVRVIEEGLNGRTTRLDEVGRADRNGLTLLPVLLESHRPLDIVVMMLGTNDLKALYNQSAEQIAQSAKVLCQTVLENPYLNDENLEGKTQVILVAPTLITKLPLEDDGVFAGASDKSLLFGQLYRQVAQDLDIHFVDASDIVQTTEADGIHWEAHQHGDFGKALAVEIQSIFSQAQ